MASSSGIACGNTKIVYPTGIHKATIVWLHDIGQKGLDSTQFVRKLNLPNVKWICPVAPKRPVTSWGGIETTAWCDVTGISENMEDDLVSLNSISAFVISLLRDEPENVMIGIGGIGLGAAVALYLATIYITGRKIRNLSFIVGINGWLPAWRNLLHNLSFDYGSPSLAPSVSILLTHGTSDDIVPFPFGRKSSDTLRMAGFPVTFIPNEGDHLPIVPQVINDVRLWITTKLQP
ncbi:unnamed protein product [Arabidopsis halleri]